ncbi:MAG: anhydro-N-acetylmuramic acid kinase [Cyanothece sp. SIO1E1]|nr:anhydro-N-acetylmuramic acid kinase [Cyanothece sp. SIO1E1]
MDKNLRVIGLISGTSVDGIDAALVDIVGAQFELKIELLAAATYPYPRALREQILAVAGGAALSMEALAALDDAIAYEFAQAALKIQAGQLRADLIGSHGQTVYHRPPPQDIESGAGTSVPLGYSLQLGRGELIANLTGMTTISNFRAADMAAGGHGAPLVPAVDVSLLSHPTYGRCVQNIGGIGNLTYLPARARGADSAQLNQVRGWDTGPGNALLDLAVQHLSQGARTYDQDGAWAATGTPCQALVQQWLQQDFFQQLPPKSTGRELFGPAYLQSCLADAEPYQLAPADFLATLTELTAASIVESYRAFLPQMPDQVLLGGGGSHNVYLKDRLQQRLGSIELLTTDAVGVNADFKEAIAFAVLGFWRHTQMPGNLPEVTGARRALFLGDIHTCV